MSSSDCPTCRGPLWPNEIHRCYFAQHVPCEDEDPLRHHWEETSITLDYAQVVSHAVFCVAKYDEEVGGEVRPNAARLSELLDDLLEETERRLRRFYLATQDQPTVRKEG